MDENFINCERIVPSIQALKIVMTELNHLGLDLEYKCAGNTLQTYHCKLIDPVNNWIFYGCGKGIGIQSKVSATFEALEHYYCYKLATNNKHDSLKFMSYAEVLGKESNLPVSNFLPKRMIAEEFSNITLPWVEFVTFQNNNEFYYPLFLIEPHYLKFGDKFNEDYYDYQDLCSLACDSGTASGSSFIEAALHGLNECVERDATSIFLVEAFLKQNPIHLIDKLTLPENLLQYVKLIEEEFDDELAVVDITSDSGIPTFCVAFTRQNVLIQPKGFGTSLNKNYALERALLESLQPLHLRNANLVQMEKIILQNFVSYPKLQAAAIADIAQMVTDKNFITTSFQKLADPIQNYSDISSQLVEIIRRINAIGLTPHYMYLTAAENEVTCLKLIVPGMDNFFLVSDGKLVLPGKRSLKEKDF